MDIAEHVGLGKSYVGEQEKSHPESIFFNYNLDTGHGGGLSSDDLGFGRVGEVGIARQAFAEEVASLTRLINHEQGARVDARECVQYHPLGKRHGGWPCQSAERSFEHSCSAGGGHDYCRASSSTPEYQQEQRMGGVQFTGWDKYVTALKSSATTRAVALLTVQVRIQIQQAGRRTGNGEAFCTIPDMASDPSDETTSDHRPAFDGAGASFSEHPLWRGRDM